MFLSPVGREIPRLQGRGRERGVVRCGVRPGLRDWHSDSDSREVFFGGRRWGLVSYTLF